MSQTNLSNKQKSVLTVIGIFLFGLIAFQFADFSMRVTPFKTTYYTYDENHRLDKIATAYDKLFEGSSQKNRKRAKCHVANYIYLNESYVLEENDTKMLEFDGLKKQVRVSPFYVGGTINHTYLFRSNITAIEQLPYDEYIEAFNLEGFYYRFEVRDLDYYGDAGRVTSPLSLPNNIKITFDDGYSWARIYKSGIFKVQYRIDSDYEKINLRLFDPEKSYTFSSSTCTDYTCNNVNTVGTRLYLTSNATTHLIFEDGVEDLGANRITWVHDGGTAKYIDCDATATSNLYGYTNDTRCINFSQPTSDRLRASYVNSKMNITGTEFTILGSLVMHEYNNDDNTVFDGCIGNGAGAGGFQVNIDDGIGNIGIGDGTGNTFDNAAGIYSQTAGKAYCIAIRWHEAADDVRSIEYYDETGVELADDATPRDLYKTIDNPWFVGARWNSNADNAEKFSNTDYDKVAVYEQELSAAEIKKWCNSKHGFFDSSGNITINYTFVNTTTSINVSFVAENDSQTKVCFWVHSESSPQWRCANTTGITVVSNVSHNITFLLNSTNSSKVPVLISTAVDAVTTGCSNDSDCGLCEKCVSTVCENQNSTEDLKSECGIIQCDGDAGTPYYSGFNASFTCYYKLDVNATTAVCDGAGACKNAATLCPSQPQNGNSSVTCDCENAEIGCTGTTIGSCNNPVCANGSAVSGLVVNLTFDNSSDPWKDNSNLSHTFTAHGSANWVNRSFCKWYGCVNLTTSAGADYLSTTTEFALEDGIAVSWWHRITASIGSSQGDWMFASVSSPDRKYTEEGGYGVVAKLKCANGEIVKSFGSSSASQYNVWEHYFIQYNESHLKLWKNGAYDSGASGAYGALNYSVGETFLIGKIIYNIDTVGYIDEFQIWNRSNFTTSDVLSVYNSKKDGTPPDVDLFVHSIKYVLPYNFSHENNSLMESAGSVMPINITIKNQGVITNANRTNWNVTLDDATVCSGSIQLNIGASTTVICNWTSSFGFHKGYVNIDVVGNNSEDDETNNQQRLYIPFMDRPWFHFNLSYWTDTLKPYASNPSNVLAYDSYEWSTTFNSADFNEGYDGNNVDPYGKKGRGNAHSCLVNGYPVSTQCTRARNHLFGWGNRTLSTYSDVQSIHELFHVGMTYDYMFPNLTKAENALVAEEYHNICQQITNLQNTRPDNDNSNAIEGGNGKGFGSGMAGFCYNMLGAWKDNPTLIQEVSDSYWGKNIADEWMDREISYLRAYKNDSWAQYQEGWAYKSYSQPHLLENWIMFTKYDLADLSTYQNAICAMGRELATVLLDHTYYGTTLRNDEGRRWRAISRGDTNSYQAMSDIGWVDQGMSTYLGRLCDDTDVKKSMLKIKEITYDLGYGEHERSASYLYKELLDQAGSSASPEASFPHTIMDNANDILTVRTNYNYVNDTVIQIDGGEERGSGHSQAQGYFLYALGEPFIDYEQVPYDDDVRMDVWKNGISLKNTSQTDEGTDGVWNNAIGEYGYNQYYGNNGQAYYSTDYPNYRTFPLAYGGDLESYAGTEDADWAGVYTYRPYYNADDVKEYFVKFGDVLAKRSIVDNNTQGEGVYHNFISINDEFTTSVTGTNFTMNRSNKFLKTQLLYDNTSSIVLGGGETPISICFAKTSCGSSNSNYSRLYYHTNYDANVDMIHSHHWYYSGSEVSISAVSGTDNGLVQGSRYILFDTDNDGDVNYSTYDATGWALGYDSDEMFAMNTTYMERGANNLIQTNDSVSVHVKWSGAEMVVSTNTFKRKTYIDEVHTVRFTVSTTDLTNNSGYLIKDKADEIVAIVSSSTTQVVFDAETDQNGDFYTITASGQSDNTSLTLDWFNPDGNANHVQNHNKVYSVNVSCYSPSVGSCSVNLSIDPEDLLIRKALGMPVPEDKPKSKTVTQSLYKTRLTGEYIVRQTGDESYAKVKLLPEIIDNVTHYKVRVQYPFFSKTIVETDEKNKTIERIVRVPASLEYLKGAIKEKALPRRLVKGDFKSTSPMFEKGDKFEFISEPLNPYVDKYVKFGDNSIIVQSESEVYTDGLLDNVVLETNCSHLQTNMTGNVLYMNFDCDNSTVAHDWSGKGNDGVVTGATLGDGKYGRAFEFDGVNDKINIIDADSLDFDNLSSYTISLWFKGLKANQNANPRIIEKYSNYYCYITRDTGTFGQMQCKQYDGTNVLNTYYDGNWLDGNWHLMTHVVDRVNQKAYLYEDGILKHTDVDISNVGDSTSNNPVVIGSNYIVTQAWNGSIDEVAIWNRSLSADEIAQLYNQTFPKYNAPGTFQPNGINITPNNYNRANFTIDNVTLLNNTYLEVALGEYNGSAWVFTNYQNYSDSMTFNISNANETNFTTKLRFNSDSFNHHSLVTKGKFTYDSYHESKGLIPACPDYPFCTNDANPNTTFSIPHGESKIFNWTVNATGTIGFVYEFFANVTLASDSSVKNSTSIINVTIIAGDDCTCPDGINHDCLIDEACSITSDNDIGTGNLLVDGVVVRILADFKANLCRIYNSGMIIVNNTHSLKC